LGVSRGGLDSGRKHPSYERRKNPFVRDRWRHPEHGGASLKGALDMGVQNEVQLLRKLPLFADTQVAHLQVLVFSAERTTLRKGQTLVSQGEQSGAGWLIRKGKAEASSGQGGQTRKLARLERGALVGELALVANLPHRLTVTALSSVSCLRIPNELFLRACGEFPEFGQQVLDNLARRFSRSMAELAQVREMFDKARSFAQPRT